MLHPVKMKDRGSNPFPRANLKKEDILDLETRITLIDLIGNFEMLMDAMVEQEIMKPTLEFQLIREDYKNLKSALCEPFRAVNKENKDV